MKLVVTGIQGAGFTEVTAEHGTKKLSFATKVYSKVKLAEQQRVFKEINSYWEFLGPVPQQNIWESYEKIHEILNMSLDSGRVAMSLRHYIREMYTHMPMNGMRRWLATMGNLFIPVEIEKQITAESRYNKKDQTYLEHEYINLATVSLAIRPMIPVFGEYLESSSESDHNKETEVLGLLYDCEVANWPQNEVGPHGEEVDTAFDKLAGYVQFCVEDEPTTLARLWRQMSTVEVPIHLRSKVLVRRLTIVPLDDITSFSIVANTYRYVRSIINPAERTTAERVNEKKPESGGDEDEKTSFLEAHKTKHRVQPGDIEAFNLDANDHVKLTQRVDPTMDMKKLQQCMRAINQVSNMPINPHQVKIAQWVMARAFPAKAFYHINKVAVNKLLAQAQAVLWHWGFLDIAVFMQVELMKQGESGSQFQLGSTRTNSRIPNRFKDELNELFPHQKAPQYTNAGVPTRTENMAGTAISTATASIHASNWVYRGPDELWKAAGQVTSNKVLVIPQTIKATLTELVLHLGRINK